MLTIRLVEERIREARLVGTVSGSVHLATGQEATAVGVAQALGPDDALFCTYRGHNYGSLSVCR